MRIRSRDVAVVALTGLVLVVASCDKKSPTGPTDQRTFLISGIIRDSGFGIAGVTVTVTSGIGEGLTTLSGATGFYALDGVSGPVQLQVKKEGYRNAIHSVDVTANRRHDFNLEVEQPRTDYGGTYTLTISAASPCHFLLGTFPEEAKRRVNIANVEQDGGRLTVTLSDADFIVTDGFGNRFSGLTDPTGTMTFEVGEFGAFSSRFDIVERFSGGALAVGGTVTATGTPQRIAGALNGSILTSDRTSDPFEPFNASCYSETHGFEMVRR